MPQPGDSIAHYKIISAIGAGGMGQVFLAEDTRLGRRVALKILLDSVATDSETRRRFGQEARSASALNQPNIITIYEVGQWEGNDYIAMEFAEGQNVRTLMSAHVLELDDILDIGAQVASALAAAHAAGIVHRDIKPENIIRRPDGLVKVLDFGLAKQTISALDSAEVDSEAATYGVMLTTPGMVMGTLPYMSPEQARGKAVDGRTDIWSLGVVLYEMIAGEQPFSGETKSDLLAAILTKQTDPLPVKLPDGSHELDNVIKKALTKNRDERYQSAKDLQIDLKILRNELNSGAFKTEVLLRATTGPMAVKTDGNITPTELHRPARSRWMWPAAIALVALAAAAVWFAWYRGIDAPPPTPVISQITSWKSALGESLWRNPRLSPDGRFVTYTALKEGRSAVWIKQLAGGEPFTLKPDDSANTNPVWSPDGQRIAYLSDRDGKRGIWSSPAFGGTAQLVGVIPPGESSLASWAPNGGIYFERSHNLYSLNTTSGEITKLTNFDERILINHSVDVSPDEKRIAYVDWQNGQIDIWIANLDGSTPVQVTNDQFIDSTPHWHPDGKRIIYTTERDGIKQIFVAYANGREPAPVLLSDGDLSVADVSTDGRKILYTNAKDDSDIWAVNTEGGKETQLTSDIGPEFWPEAAPDGSSIAYQGVRRTSIGGKLLNCSVYVQQVSTDARPTEITTDGSVAGWSPDGKRVAFVRSEGGSNSLWVSSATGGDARRLTQTGVMMGGYTVLPFNRVYARDFDWSPDGGSLVYAANRNDNVNIWHVSTAGQGESQLSANTDKDVLFFSPVYSPDGLSIAWLGRKKYSATKYSWGIWLQSGDRTEQVYQYDSALRLLGWSASGASLIVEASGETNLQVYPRDLTIFEIAAADGNARKIAELKSVYFSDVALSPDKRTLAFVSRTDSGDALNVMPAAGGNQKRLVESSDPRVYFSSIAFSPDGKTLYYGKQANWQVISSINNFK